MGKHTNVNNEILERIIGSEAARMSRNFNIPAEEHLSDLTSIVQVTDVTLFMQVYHSSGQRYISIRPVEQILN